MYTSERDQFGVQCAGRGGEIDRAFNYTSQEMVKKVNSISGLHAFRSKLMK